MSDRNERGQFIKGHSLGLRFGCGQKIGDMTGRPSCMKGKHHSEECHKQTDTFGRWNGRLQEVKDGKYPVYS